MMGAIFFLLTGLGLADSLIVKAQESAFSSPRQSLYYSQRALQHECSDLQRARALLAGGTANKLMGDFDLGIALLYDALEACPQDEHALRTDILMQIANVYCRLRDYNKAFEVNDMARASSKIHGDSLRLAASFNNRGMIHYNLNEFTTADALFRSALAINRHLGDVKAVAANLNNICLYEGPIDEKLPLIREAIAINSRLNATWALAENYNNMGKQYFFAGRYDEALEALALARQAAEQSGAKELISDNFEYASQVYAAQKRFDRAYEALSRLYTMSIEMQNAQKLRSVERRLSEKRVARLEEQTRVREQSYRIAILRRNILILASLVAILVGVAIFVPRGVRRRAERELAQLRLRQREQALHDVETELELSRQEAMGFAMFVRSRSELLDKIRAQIKDGYRLEADELHSHLKKVNAFIAQHQANGQDAAAMVMSIEKKNVDFLGRLHDRHPGLTRGERYLATLLRVNLSTKEISLLTGATPKTVNMNRYRLRKSLGLNAGDDLVEYLRKM